LIGDFPFLLAWGFGWLGVPPCWRAYFLLLRQKKVAKEKATPGAAPALPVPCATRNAGRLAKLACGSNNASRLPPAFLRCSAPSTGTPNASGLDLFAEKADFHGQPEKTAKNEICWRRSPAPPPSLPRTRESRPLLDSRLRGNDGTSAWPRIVSPGPLRGAEQRRGWRIKGEDCLRAKPEFRSPRQHRVAQGTGAAGTDPGSPSSLLTFFLAKQEESKTRLKRGKPRLRKGTSAESAPPPTKQHRSKKPLHRSQPGQHPLP